MTSKNLEIDDILKSISDEIERNKLNKRYGTSIDESMSHQQRKDVRNQINILLSELENELNLNFQAQISKTNLQDYYNKTKSKYNWNEYDFNEEYQNQIFNLLKHPFEEQIQISEFLKQYILLEEGMKIRNNVLNQQKENLSYNISEYEDQIRKHSKAMTNTISLGISIFEAVELENLNGDYFVKLYCDDTESKISQIGKISLPRIIWNENFKFNLNERNKILHIELLQKTLALSRTIGKIDFILENLSEDQQRVEDFYPIKDSNDETIGKIRIKLHYVYNVIDYFKALLNKANNELSQTNNILDILSKFNNYYDKPFGIIMSGGINYLNNIDNNENNILDIAEDVENIDYGVRKSVMHNPLNDSQRFSHNVKNINPQSPFKTGNNALTIDKLKENDTQNNYDTIEWEKSTYYLIIISLCITFFNNVLDRNDLINFMGCFSLLLMYFFNGKYNPNYLKYAFYYFILTEAIDLIWLFAHFGTYSISDGYLSMYKELIYGFSFINFIIKGVITYFLFKLIKKNKQIQDPNQNSMI